MTDRQTEFLLVDPTPTQLFHHVLRKTEIFVAAPTSTMPGKQDAFTICTNTCNVWGKVFFSPFSLEKTAFPEKKTAI